MNDTIRKALQGASQILKGGSSAVTAAELEAALLYLGDLRKLLDDHDPDAQLLSKALDMVRVAQQQGETNVERQLAKARLVEKANGLIDQHVSIHKRTDETEEAAHARLARDRDMTFTELFEHLRQCQEL